MGQDAKEAAHFPRGTNSISKAYLYPFLRVLALVRENATLHAPSRSQARRTDRQCINTWALARQKLLAERARAIPFDPLELPMEIGVVAESYLKADFENAEISVSE